LLQKKNGSVKWKAKENNIQMWIHIEKERKRKATHAYIIPLYNKLEQFKMEEKR